MKIIESKYTVATFKPIALVLENGRRVCPTLVSRDTLSLKDMKERVVTTAKATWKAPPKRLYLATVTTEDGLYNAAAAVTSPVVRVEEV